MDFLDIKFNKNLIKIFVVNFMFDYFIEPRCKVCARLVSPIAFNPHTPENHYKSSVTWQKKYCNPRRCNVGTNMKSEFGSRSYHVDRLVNKLQELNRNVQDLDESKRYDETLTSEQRRVLEQSANNRITDLESAHNAVRNCLREMDKLKTFLEDENSWWTILKDRTIKCCQRKSPHLHGVLDGSSVILILSKEEKDKTPHHFATSTPKKGRDIADFNFHISSARLANDMKRTEQRTYPWEEQTEDYADYTVPCYNLDAKLTSIEVTRHDPTQRYARTFVKSKQSTIASDLRMEAQEDSSGEQRKPDWSSRSKEMHDKIQSEKKEKRVDRSNSKKREQNDTTYKKIREIASSKETRYGQSEDKLKPRETFSSENTGKVKKITADFESNADLDTEFPSKNMAGHRPRTIAGKKDYYIQKYPMKISKSRSRN